MHLRHRNLRKLGLAAATLSMIALYPDAAPAQGLFGTLFRALAGRPAEPAYAPSNAYAPPAADPWEQLLGSPEPVDPRTRAEGPVQTYCVRLCDGRYFPLPRSVGTAAYTPAKTCNALCPAAKTKIFSGAGIGPAVAPDGTRYANLENAFVYREQVIDGCTCNGKDAGGIARIEVEQDPTLKPGDIVVTDSGPMVFTGGKVPYRTNAFTLARDYPKLSQQLRSELSGMRVATTPASAPEASQEAAPGTPPRSTEPVSTTRVPDRQVSQAWRELAARQSIFANLAWQVWSVPR